MKELVELIAKALVEKPSEVRVTEHDNGQGVVTYELSVDSSDMGKVIGKQGRIARSIRTVMKAAATKENKKVFVEIK